MKRSYSPNYGEPKYKSQSLVFDRLKVVFDDAIKEREELLSNQKNNENKNKIVKVDLRIAICIKNAQGLLRVVILIYLKKCMIGSPSMRLIKGYYLKL